MMYAPVTGGGTATVEFEALTGSSASFLPSGTVAYQLYLTDQTPSLAQTAKILGVRSSAYVPWRKLYLLRLLSSLFAFLPI